MFRVLLLISLIVIAVVLGLRMHRRLQDFVLVNLAPGASVVLHEAWAVLVELWPASDILAAAVLLVAVSAALGLSHFHFRIMLERQRKRLDCTYRDNELAADRDGCHRIERDLATTKERLQDRDPATGPIRARQAQGRSRPRHGTPGGRGSSQTCRRRRAARPRSSSRQPQTARVTGPRSTIRNLPPNAAPRHSAGLTPRHVLNYRPVRRLNRVSPDAGRRTRPSRLPASPSVGAGSLC